MFYQMFPHDLRNGETKQKNNMITTSIVYDHRGRAEKNTPGPVEIRVTVERKSYYINSGIRVLKSNFAAGCVVNQCDADELNQRLRIIYARVQELCNRYIEQGRPIDVKAIKTKAWQMAEDNDVTLLDFIEQQEKVMNLTPGTIQHYATLRLRLTEYGKLLRWSDLTAENICLWDAWLHELKVPQSAAERKAGEPVRCVGDGTVYNYHKCLKAILNRAVMFDKIDVNPYDKLRGRFKKGDVKSLEFLTSEEMQAVESLHPVKGSTMAVARDLFVFQMHTGLSYADTQEFDFSQYTKKNGKWVNIGHRVKTGVEYMAMLTEECVRILESYGWTLPKIANSEYNRCLKALGVAAGVKTPLHSHLARHSFATRARAMGAHLDDIAKMLGHTNTVQTQRYAKIMPEQVFAQLEKIEKLTKINNDD